MADLALKFFQESLDSSKNGIGIAHLDLQQQFEKFSREHPGIRIIDSSYSAVPYTREEQVGRGSEMKYKRSEILHTFYILYEC